MRVNADDSEPMSYSTSARMYRFRAFVLVALVLVALPSAVSGVEGPRTRLVFPLRGRFVVVAGHAPGEAHAEERSQRYAIDVVNVDARGREHRGRGTRNTDWAGFGREVVAPAGGIVVWAKDGYPDNRPGHAPGVERYAAIAEPYERRMAIAGNAVVIDHGNGELSVLAHLRRGSVRVRTGSRVRRGQVVGRVGNSGNSTEPHLHYHLMNGPRLLEADGIALAFTNVVAAALTAGSIHVAK